jgi:hypothetical protein
MMLVISLILAVLPLLGVVWIAVYGSLTTVDGLFTSLILLSISGILGLNVLLELRRLKQEMSGAHGGPVKGGVPQTGNVRHGKVKDVVFFEANVGEPNKSIVTLADGAGSSQTLVLDGDLRNALPVGQSVRILVRKEDGRNVLADVSYS